MNLRLARATGKPVDSSLGTRLLISREQAMRRIDQAETVSFDFFDTLVTRRSADPDAVQRLVGALCERRNPTRKRFFVLRKQAEEAARAESGSTSDVGLTQIYARFERGLGWDDQAIEETMHLEIEIDTRSCLPRHVVVDLLRYAKNRGKRVLIVSDTYYSRHHLQKIIDRVGIDSLVDEIYLSSERGARKDTGDLWDLLLRVERAGESGFLHIGDNIQSDIDLSVARGIDGAFVPASPTTAILRGLRFSLGLNWIDDILMGPLCARFGNDPFHDFGKATSLCLTTEEELGYVVFGPLLLKFMGWLITQAAAAEVDCLFFCSREGYFLKELYDRLRYRAAWKNLPESRYLLVSRQAMILANQAHAFDINSIVGRSSFSGSLRTFLKARLGWEDPALDDFLQEIRIPEDQEFLRQALDVLRPRIAAWAFGHSDAMRTYHDEIGLTRAACPVLVDIGYSGTIQRNIQQHLGRPVLGLYLATSADIGRTLPSGLAFGCYRDSNYGDGWDVPFSLMTVAMEAFLTAPHGQLTRFIFDTEGHPVPVFLDGGPSQAKFDRLEAIFSGVKAYADDLLESFPADVLSELGTGSSAALLPLKMLINGGLKLSRKVADSLSLEDAYTGAGDIRMTRVYRDMALV